MAGTSVAINLGIETGLEKWLGRYAEWKEAWDKTEFGAYKFIRYAVEGASADKQVLATFVAAGAEITDYVLNTPKSQFRISHMFLNGVKGAILEVFGGVAGKMVGRGTRIINKHAVKGTGRHLTLFPNLSVLRKYAQLVYRAKLWRHLIPISPARSGNISKTKVLNYAMKTDATSVPGMNALYPSIPNTLTNKKLGEKGEQIAEFYVEHFSPNSTILKGNNIKVGSDNGFDLIAIDGGTTNPSKITIFEVKQAKPAMKLNPEKGLNPRQMSDDWLEKVIQDMLQSNNPSVMANGVFLNKNKLKIELRVLGICKQCPDPVGGGNKNQLIDIKLDRYNN